MSKLLHIAKIRAALLSGGKYDAVVREPRRAGKRWFTERLLSTDADWWPERDKFMAIYTTDQIKQLQIDTQWPGTVDLYEHIKNYVRDSYKCKD